MSRKNFKDEIQMSVASAMVEVYSDRNQFKHLEIALDCQSKVYEGEADNDRDNRDDREYPDVYVQKCLERKNNKRNEGLNKKYLRKIEPLTMAVRPSHNGDGIVREGNRSTFDWKKYDHKIDRYSGKAECKKYTDQETIFVKEINEDDAENEEFGYEMFLEFEEYSADHPETTFSEWYENVYEYDYDDYDDDDDYYYGYDPYQAAIDDRNQAWDAIASYKAFIKEYNLEKLYNAFIQTREGGDK